MYQVLSTEIKAIGKKEALELLKLNTYEHQRSVRQWHVNELAKKMTEGQYTTGNVVVGINGKSSFIADGQHTLNGVVQSGVSVNVVLQKVKCHTPKDVALLWQQYDGGIPRSIVDYVRSEAGALGLDWSAGNTALIAGSAVIAEHGPTCRGITKAGRTALLKKYIYEGDFVHKLIAEDKPTISKHMRRQPVVAVIMLSSRKSEEDAEIFWGQVKTGELLMSTDPAYHLRNFLLTSAVKGNSLTRLSSPREFFVKSIKAWNAFRDDSIMKILRYSTTESIPEIK